MLFSDKKNSIILPEFVRVISVGKSAYVVVFFLLSVEIYKKKITFL